VFTHFKKAYDSIRREVLSNIIIDLGIPMELVRLIKMCLPLLFIFALLLAVRRVQVIRDGLKLNDTHQLLVYADNVYYIWMKLTY
jgi:hypothetical protein